MIAALREPAPAVHDAAASLAELIELANAGDLTAVASRLKTRAAQTPRPVDRNRKRECSGPVRNAPIDPRDWWLIELDLPDAAKSSIERALFAAGITCDEPVITAGALCRWSTADLVKFGVEPAAVDQLRRALGKVRLRLRG